MSVFTYRARTADGGMVSGTMQSDTEELVVRELKRNGCFPVDIREAGAGARASAGVKGVRVRRETLVDFFRELNDLLKAGMPLVRALDLLASNLKDKRMAGVSRDLCESVKGGLALNEALRNHPRAFPPLIAGIVRAGEGGGGLENVLGEIIRFLEEECSLAGRVRGLLAYPVMMALMGGGTLIFFLTFVIPRFAEVFEEMGQSLPLLTRVLLAAGAFIGRSGWFALPALAALLFLMRAYAATAEGRRMFHRWLLSIPFFGEVVSELNIGRFTRALGLMLRNGVPLLQALELALDAVGNGHIRSMLGGLAGAAREGTSLNAALRGSGAVDDMVVDLVKVGEETGRLSEVMLHIGERYEKKAYANLQFAVTVLEPAIIVAVGIVVAVVVLGMMLPILQINLAV
ncbi:MAG: type II secretion system F family protein [bacterium]